MPKPGRKLIDQVLAQVHPDKPRRVSDIAERISKKRGTVAIDTVGACLRILRDEGRVRKTTRLHEPSGGYVLSPTEKRRRSRVKATKSKGKKAW